jgi:hypothetical protein
MFLTPKFELRKNLLMTIKKILIDQKNFFFWQLGKKEI